MTQWPPPTPPTSPQSWPPPASPPPADSALPLTHWSPPTAPALSGYSSANGLAKALRWVFAGWVLLAGVSAALSFETYRAVSDGIMAPGAFDRLTTLDDRRVAVGLVELAAYLLTGILFIIWTRCVYRNLPALGAPDLRHKPGWAVGGWFVPFANLVIPKVVVNDSWRGSGPDDGRHWRQRKVAPVIDFWWAALLLGSVVTRVTISADAPDDANVEAWPFLAEAVASLLTIAAAILAFWVVTRLTERQEQKYRTLSETRGAASTDWTVIAPVATRSTAFAHEPTARWALPAIAVVAIALGALVFSSTDGDAGSDPVTGSAEWIGALPAGACFDLPPGGATGNEEVDVVNCTEAHDAEVYAVQVDPSPPGSAYAGEEVTDTLAFNNCYDAFGAYVGTSYEQSPLEFSYMYPTEQSWSLGDRSTLCYLTMPDGGPLTASMRNGSN